MFVRFAKLDEKLVLGFFFQEKVIAKLKDYSNTGVGTINISVKDVASS